MSNKKSSKNDTLVKIDKIVLMVFGVLKAISAAIYLLLIVLLMTNGNIMSDLIAEAGDAKIEGISTEMLVYVVCGATAAVNALTAFLMFRATRPGVKSIVLLVIAAISLIYTSITQVHGWGNWNWAYVFPTFVNLATIGIVVQLNMYNKK